MAEKNERIVTAHMHSLSRDASAYSNFLPTLARWFRIFSMRVNLNEASLHGEEGKVRDTYAYAFSRPETLDRIERNDSTIVDIVD